MRNVQRLQFFARPEREATSGRISTFGQWKQEFGFEPGGVNFYVSFSSQAEQQLKKEGTPEAALNAFHRSFFADVRAAIAPSTFKSKTVLLSIEPREPGDPYGFVRRVEAEHGRVTKMAQELHALQEEAKAEGSLDIIVRYASEMNDGGSGHNAWAARPASEFIDSHRFVRDIFREHAPRVRFSFSPALREDITPAKLEAIKAFWPGRPDDPLPAVDVIGCTWYVGKQADMEEAARVMRRYFAQRQGRGLPFGFDEMGGIDGQAHNDKILEQMLHEVEALEESDEMAFEYLTFFLGGKFGRDATLSFLQGGQLEKFKEAEMAKGRVLSLQDPQLQGEDVKALQQALAREGVEVLVDGDFGPQTEAAVRAFQSGRGLLADGIVGPVTGRALGLEIEKIEGERELLKHGLHPAASDALRRLGITGGRIMQTIGNAQASAGTHAAEPYLIGGVAYCAAVDLRSKDMDSGEIRDLLEGLAREGFAAWDRHPGRDGWPEGQAKHIHAVYAGCPMKHALRRQVADFLEGKNGLKSHASYEYFSPSGSALTHVRNFFHAQPAGAAPQGEAIDEDPEIHCDHACLEDELPPMMAAGDTRAGAEKKLSEISLLDLLSGGGLKEKLLNILPELLSPAAKEKLLEDLLDGKGVAEVHTKAGLKDEAPKNWEKRRCLTGQMTLPEDGHWTCYAIWTDDAGRQFQGTVRIQPNIDPAKTVQSLQISSPPGTTASTFTVASMYFKVDTDGKNGRLSVAGELGVSYLDRNVQMRTLKFTTKKDKVAGL